MLEVRVVADPLNRVPAIKVLFEFHQFGWMAQAPEYYRPAIIQDFYSYYATSLLNYVVKGSQKLKQQLALKFVSFGQVEVQGAQVDISEDILHGSDYMTPQDGPFARRYQQVIDEERMSDPTSRVVVLSWIAKQIALQDTNIA